MNSCGTNFKVSIYGASHESSMGVIIDNMPPGMEIDTLSIIDDLNRRRPKHVGTTSRVEKDMFIIKNGIFNNKTTGAPLHIEVENKNIKSKDYKNILNHPRPSHADFVSSIKYKGYNDYRGGGFFSGRMTALLVIAGAIAKQIIPYKFISKIKNIGTSTNPNNFDEYLREISNQKDSVGGNITLTIKNVEVGLGDPLFNKLDAKLSQMLFSVPGVKGVYFGNKIDDIILGSKYNDNIINKNGETKTNNSGGINGGISNGNDITIEVAIKPTPSIGIAQNTYNFNSNKVEPLLIKGRHDVAFIRRLPVVLENVCAIVLADFYLANRK